MNSITVPSIETWQPTQVLEHLADTVAVLTPQLRKAATYMLENPGVIGVSSTRQIAKAAGVKPNTLVRLARTIGFDGFESFREPFREEIREGRESFPDRARWLQSLAKGGKLRKINADMAAAAIDNIEKLYSDSNSDALKAAADQIVSARRTYVLGIGIANVLARNFSYLLGMALDNVSAIPQDGSLPVDALVQARPGDVLVAMTFKPYRREVVEAVEAAREQGVEIIAISDSPAAPILAPAAHRFVVPTDTPQFFTSMVAVMAFLETLVAFVIADADKAAVNSIDRFHERRHELGVYWPEGESL